MRCLLVAVGAIDLKLRADESLVRVSRSCSTVSRPEYLNFEDSVVSCEVSLLASMEELHLLRLDDCHVVVPNDFSSWPHELRWLQWRSFCFSSLPPHLS
jgi:hypothetical protein